MKPNKFLCWDSTFPIVNSWKIGFYHGSADTTETTAAQMAMPKQLALVRKLGS